MSQQELLKEVVMILEDIGIPYMITGSIASSLQGEPRSTHDIDIIVHLKKNQIKKIIDSFSSNKYYIDEISVKKAVKNQEMFNIIDFNTGDKVDFWMFIETPFDKSRFSRRVNEKIMGLKMQISSPEDTILAKLRWAKHSGGSEKQFTDALRVYEVQRGELDIDYIERWVKKLDVESLWKRVKKEAV
ncbi:MAG: nucleotidyltransferase domain-containing protein [Elusimicrobiota bacterium]